MAPANESQKDEAIKYLLLVMKHAEFKPNYHKVAQEVGLSNANNAQKRFKKIVESGGFALVGGAVVEPGAIPATQAKPRAAGKSPAATLTPAKKRKTKGSSPCEENDKSEDM